MLALLAALAAPVHADEPRFMGAAEVGLIPLTSIRAEFLPRPDVSIQAVAGYNLSLLPPTFDVGVRWRPNRREGWSTHNLVWGPALRAGFYPMSNGAGVYMLADVELMYAWRPDNVGFFAGCGVGIGPVTEFGDGRDWTRIEPMLGLTLLRLGVMI